jgi:putative toxin-antitoxin system antitoxin component (TIGR02293 family)
MQPKYQVVEVLGGRSMVREQAAVYGNSAVVPQLKIDALAKVAQRLSVDVDRLRRILGISARTWDRRKTEGVLSADESDRLLRLARVIRQAIEVFGTDDKAREWLVRPNRALEHSAPIDLLGTDSGATAVSDELVRIDYGDLY